MTGDERRQFVRDFAVRVPLSDEQCDELWQSAETYAAVRGFGVGEPAVRMAVADLTGVLIAEWDAAGRLSVAAMLARFAGRD